MLQQIAQRLFGVGQVACRGLRPPQRQLILLVVADIDDGGAELLDRLIVFPCRTSSMPAL